MHDLIGPLQQQMIESDLVLQQSLMADLGLLPTLDALGSGIVCLIVWVGGTALPISPVRIPEGK